ncbi:aldehyde dehydrogenase (NADP(+)) [Actinomadura sp. CNU-125]|uniref:aldehyde dehydrogenase (NADP(+)) n=1 Tax=Actinomadura sp. CNU-125 TaxID=1904961 RepID=UPI000B279027|nr:aldehyde dehydrogenase (NADP(+)) [Actinomadura sp. CNU-125]
MRIADAETALGPDRLRGELARSAFQFRLFAEAVEEGSWLGASIDHARADAVPAPRPDLRRMLVPVGVVAVFGASNFPFAFGVPGGDVAAALAAGCPVVVKAHPAHPELSERCARIVRTAATSFGLPADVLRILHGRDAGTALVVHPLVRAVGFTGSAAGGRALHDLAKSRPQPVPFYGELGSLNPVVVTPAAARERGEDIARGLTASANLGVGQFCVKPGLVLVPAGSAIAARMAELVRAVPSGTMLTDGIRTAFDDGVAARAALPGVTVAATGEPAGDRTAAASLLTAPASLLHDSAAAELLLDECFGPTTVLVPYADEAELFGVLDVLPGSLTGTVHTGDDDPVGVEAGRRLAERAGRIVWNGYPTGVAVSWAQQHGGPYPSSTEPATTSVGVTAMARFLRPIVHQDSPPGLLPAPLREDNPWGVPRRVDGVLRLG